MRLSTSFRMAALILLAALSAGLARAQQESSQQPASDPVADAARKAREEQKAAPKPKKVFTNDDLPSAPDTAPKPATDAAAKPAGGQAEISTSPSNDDEDNNPKSETYWRKRFQKLRDKINNAERELDVLQRELNKDQVQYYNDPQKAMQQQYSRSDINEKTAKIDAKKQEVDSLKQQMSNLEDELRKAGGDPGWAR